MLTVIQLSHRWHRLTCITWHLAAKTQHRHKSWALKNRNVKRCGNRVAYSFPLKTKNKPGGLINKRDRIKRTPEPDRAYRRMRLSVINRIGTRNADRNLIIQVRAPTENNRCHPSIARVQPDVSLRSGIYWNVARNTWSWRRDKTEYCWLLVCLQLRHT